MIKSLNNLNRQLISVIIPFVMLIGLMVIMKTSAFEMNLDVMSKAITIDLLLVIPLVYFLLIRKTAIPKTTVVPMIIIGLLVGTFFIPEQHQNYLNLFKVWMLPVIEIGLVSFILYKVRSTIKKFKSLQLTSPDLFTILKLACSEILPKKLITPFATEIAVVYYGFFNWKSRTLESNEYSYHKDSSSQALFGALILMIGTETFVLHLVLVESYEVIAWVLMGLSIYTAIQVLGFSKSLSQRPIVINSNDLILRYGLLSEAQIDLANICKVEVFNKSIDDDKSINSLSPLGALDSHNMLIYLKEERTMIGLYGLKKSYSKIAFHVDKKIMFKDDLTSKIVGI